MTERAYIAPLLRSATGEGVQIKTLRHQHLALMDYMLANPTVPMWAVANHFGRTQAWLSTIVNSDLFQAHMHERRKLIEDDQQRHINAKLFSAASQGLDALIAGISDDEVSISEKRAITRLALEASGQIGNKSGPSVVVNAVAQSSTAANSDAVNAARERILQQSRLASTVGVALPSPTDNS
jgi:hypothetical protein